MCRNIDTVCEKFSLQLKQVYKINADTEQPR